LVGDSVRPMAAVHILLVEGFCNTGNASDQGANSQKRPFRILRNLARENFKYSYDEPCHIKDKKPQRKKVAITEIDKYIRNKGTMTDICVRTVISC
jgi:hypothetical protein